MVKKTSSTRTSTRKIKTGSSTFRRVTVKSHGNKINRKPRKK